MLNKKNLIIFLFLIILLGLSGCIGFITLREKQACLALTHYSSTSISNCSSQNNCFKQVEDYDYLISDKIPYQIHNDLLLYKNYVASSYFYYNQSREKIEKINKACFNEKPKDILSNVNMLMFYVSQLMGFIDSSSKKSINVLIDYALYLEKEEVYLIVEEKIYDDYILLNKNMNQLKDNKKNDTYVSLVDQEVSNLYVLAKELGFERTYLTKYNISDLSLYYLSVFDAELQANEVFVPEYIGITSYVLSKLSDIENLRKINLNLSRVDGYNFYNVFNRFLGKDNSLVTNFKEISDKINQNIDEVYLKIKELEEDIEKNKEHINYEKYLEFKQQEALFDQKRISFGRYLSYLKNLNNEILKNKISNDKLKIEEKNNLLECDLIIEDAKKYTSIFYKNQIDLYNLTDNYLEKIEICTLLKNTINDDTCSKKIYEFLKLDVDEKKDYELFVYTNDFTCREILGNINYKLSFNEKIILLNNLLKEVKKNILEMQVYSKSYDIKKEVLNYKEKVNDIEKEDNIQKIINVDLKINEIIEINKIVKELAKEVVIENNFINIKYLDGNYFLVFYNPFSFVIESIVVDNNYKDIESKDDLLKITNTKITAERLFSKENKFKINYKNNKKINFEIIYLGLEESLVKLSIENDVEGVFDEILFLEGFKSNSLNVSIYENKINYLTEKENIIFILGDVFDKKIFREIVEISKDVIYVEEKIILKNNFLEKIDQTIYFKKTDDKNNYKIFENGKEVNFELLGDDLVFNLKMDVGEIKTYIFNYYLNKSEIDTKITEILLKLEPHKHTRFENISKILEEELNEILDVKIKEKYTFNEIEVILSKKEIINNLKKLEDELKKYESLFFILFNEIDVEKLNEEEKKELKDIYENKYRDIKEALEELKHFVTKKTERINFEENKNIEEDLLFEKEIKETIHKYNLDLVIDFRKEKEEIYEIINEKLKEKAQEIYFQISPEVHLIDSRKIEEIVNKIKLLYNDFSLREIQNIGYFPSVTLSDVERIEKNKVFLDGVLFNREMSRFEENFEKQDFKRAIDSVSLETINRVERIKIEYKVLEDGFNIIKEDARKKILNFEGVENKEDILDLSKNYYEEEKYLNVIILLSEKDEKNKETLFLNQYFIATLIVILFSAVYFYFNKSTKKSEENIKDKKRKIIRH